MTNKSIQMPYIENVVCTMVHGAGPLSKYLSNMKMTNFNMLSSGSLPFFEIQATFSLASEVGQKDRKDAI